MCCWMIQVGVRSVEMVNGGYGIKNPYATSPFEREPSITELGAYCVLTVMTYNDNLDHLTIERLDLVIYALIIWMFSSDVSPISLVKV